MRYLLFLLTAACSSTSYTSTFEDDASVDDSTGGQSATGGQGSTGGQSATGGQSVTGGEPSTGGSSSACVARTTCIAGATAATMSHDRNYVAIQCNGQTYWCSSAGCTMANPTTDMIVCTKGPCNYPFVCTDECTHVVTTLSCACGQTGVVACL